MVKVLFTKTLPNQIMFCFCKPPEACDSATSLCIQQIRLSLLSHTSLIAKANSWTRIHPGLSNRYTSILSLSRGAKAYYFLTNILLSITFFCSIDRTRILLMAQQRRAIRHSHSLFDMAVRRTGSFTERQGTYKVPI